MKSRSLEFRTMVAGWRQDLLRTLESAKLPRAVYWDAVQAEIQGSDEVASFRHLLEFMLAARVYAERELIADGLLDEKSDLFGAIGRLRGEIELRDAVVVPLLALIVLLSVTVGLYWLVALVAIGGWVWQRSLLESKRDDRILAAATVRPTRAPVLTRIERVVLAAIAPENRSNATADQPAQEAPPSSRIAAGEGRTDGSEAIAPSGF